jgi:hypothetical protein
MAEKAKGKPQTFKAMLEKDVQSLGWTIARVPFVPAAVWPTMVRLRVRGEVNGFAFRTSLFPVVGRAGEFFLLVNRTMQAGAGASLGAMAEFRLEPDLEEREAELPDTLAALLDGEDGLREFYDNMTEYARREIGKWVLGVKSEDAQMRRAEQMAERLMLTMEGERELPPIVEAAFKRRAKARTGWKNLTETQRRHELFAVFYYKAGPARDKRVQGLCEVAEKRA